MRVLIIEDEYLLADELEERLLSIDSNIIIEGKLGSIEESIEWFKNYNCDLVFSDIHLNDGLSFSIFENIKVDCPVIFTTAYDEYAIKAFDVNSIAYLLKPIEEDDLKKALNKFKMLSNQKQQNLESLLQYFHADNTKYIQRLTLSMGKIQKPVLVSDIAYFIAKGRIVFAVTNDGKRYFYDKTLYQLEEELDPKDFLRVSRSFIVNYYSVEKIISYSQGRVLLKLNPEPDEEVIVSKEKSKELSGWLSQ